MLMKKYFISAAVVAAMGAGSVYGYRTMNPNDGLSDAQLANIEALSDMEIELPEVEIICDMGTPGRCWAIDEEKSHREGTQYIVVCYFTGSMQTRCI